MNNEFIIIEFSEPWMNDPFDVERYRIINEKSLDKVDGNCIIRLVKL